jgi:hypothetical protein
MFWCSTSCALWLLVTFMLKYGMDGIVGRYLLHSSQFMTENWFIYYTYILFLILSKEYNIL